ncbi:hypothetical protein [Stakelama pacifica]|uniref:hypothetical protein n=1 Tax=Stakelama pacifica TaxID=517720 RepID=UPI00105DAE67|nr:hypothetical protein [Stakelama pacifica]
MTMLIAQNFERGTLTIDEQRSLMRQALEDELAHATRHLALPGAREADDPAYRKILIAAYTIVADVPHDTAALTREQIERHFDDSWSDAERQLLLKTLTLYITPMCVSRSEAQDALKALEAPVNEGTLAEARRMLLSGRIEAQRRASLADHPLFVDRDVPAHYLLDDALVEQARRVEPIRPSLAPVPTPVATSPAVAAQPDDSGNCLFAKISTVRFSEQIDELLEMVVDQFDYAPDNGQRRAVFERFAWITGDKLLHHYEPADIQNYVRKMAAIPATYRFGELGKAGLMAKTFNEAMFDVPTDETRRSKRTINRDLSILDKASQVLAKDAWLPRYGTGMVMNFLAEWRKVPNDPADPKRMPWTPEHLRALYSLPLWRGGGGSTRRLKPDSPPRIYQDAAYWLPLFGTYMGVSREEGAGFEVVDFNFECEVPYALVQANMTRSKDGKSKGGLKRPSRHRVMPLHPELLRLGLKDYVKAIAAEGYDMIFPELYVDAAVSGERGKKAPAKGGRRFYAISWCYLMDATHGLLPLPESSSGKKADFHSQRTYSNSVLADPDVSKSIIADHMGHARAGTGDRNYLRRALTLGEVQELKERLAVMVRHMPIVTDHIERAPVKLLHINKRSRVGSAPGRNAKLKFCQ